MDTRKPSLDLEKELTCSICTELLYQPLTLLDCLHTFCGSCLKEWFRFQAAKIERSPSPPAPDQVLFTCPSCRASVRDTRPNATVVTLLDMFFAAKPEKARSNSDKQDIAKKYQPGDQVLPKIATRERTADELRAQEDDRRLIQEVREMSLRDAETGTSSSSSPRPPRRSADERPSSSRDPRSASSSRRARSGTSQSRTGDDSRQASGQLQVDENGHRRRRSDSRQRQVEHQASIRSLISSADMSERDIEREIEDFARQIQEEGLLDGLDLDNIDLSRDDNLSRRITEAYRRRQRDRSRNETERRSNANGRHATPPRSREGEPADEDRLRPGDNAERPRSRSGTGESRADERPHQSGSSSPNMEPAPLIPTRSVRRRTMSDVRSRTMPITPSDPLVRPATRSQSDLASEARGNGHSSSGDEKNSDSLGPRELQGSNSANHASFANRVAQPGQPGQTPTASSQPSRSEATRETNTRRYRPSELTIVHSAATSPMATSPTSPGHQRRSSHLYPEPSINCSRCNKQHIEYEVHYNCSHCSGGQWVLCMDCYRRGKGCLYWFGFGRGAWSKWEKLCQQRRDDSITPPHILTPSRYLRPPTTPGGADGRKTLTTDDPKLRLESGTFCARCLAWTNDCFWRCDVCNEGEWGYCNDCVNQGKSCTHMLLPISYDVPRQPGKSGRPSTATLQTGPQARSLSSFRTLLFNSQCDICHEGIPPADARYHCFACTSTLVQNASKGDYDICSPCYQNLVSSGKISQENGSAGWRRCLKGHRMAIIAFADNEAGRWRYTGRDMVGGRGLRIEPLDEDEGMPSTIQKWVWKQGSERWERLASQNVAETAPTSLSFTHSFPPDGGMGFKAHGRWAWYPQEDSNDELLFPRGAEIREIEDVNGDWYFGVYMGEKGLFPSPYVAVVRDA